MLAYTRLLCLMLSQMVMPVQSRPEDSPSIACFSEWREFEYDPADMEFIVHNRAKISHKRLKILDYIFLTIPNCGNWSITKIWGYISSFFYSSKKRKNSNMSKEIKSNLIHLFPILKMGEVLYCRQVYFTEIQVLSIETV